MPANKQTTTRRAVMAGAVALPVAACAAGNPATTADSPALAAFRRWREAQEAFERASDARGRMTAALPPPPTVKAMGREFARLDVFDAAVSALKSEPGMDAATAARMRAQIIAAAENIKAEPPPYEAQRDAIEAARLELQRAISEHNALRTYSGLTAAEEADDAAFSAMQGPACAIEYMPAGDPNAPAVMVAYLVRQGIEGAFDIGDDFPGPFIQRLARVMLPTMPAEVAAMVRADLAQLDASAAEIERRRQCEPRQRNAASDRAANGGEG